jgi:hypothetical protein
MSTLTRPVPADRSKINMHDADQVRAWARQLVTAELGKAVETVGNSAAEVRKELARRG